MLLNKISGYEIKELITQNTLTKIYRATHLLSEREVTLKIQPVKSGAINENAVKRSLSEARISANLDHPNIAKIYDIGRHNDLCYIAVEHFPLGSLQDKLDQGDQVSVKSAIDIALQLLSALRYTHDRGYIHRNIKPENILFKADNHVVLANFGIVRKKSHGSDVAQPDIASGYAHYLAPEQVLDDSADKRSDLYSIGIVLYELIIGKITYDESQSYQEKFNSIQNSISELEGELAVLKPIFSKLLARDPNNRYQKTERSIEKLQEIKNALIKDKANQQEKILLTRTPIKKYKLTLAASFFSLLFIPAFAFQVKQPGHIINDGIYEEKATTISKKYPEQKTPLLIDIPSKETPIITLAKPIAMAPAANTPEKTRSSGKNDSDSAMRCILKLDACNEDETGKTTQQQPAPNAAIPQEPVNKSGHHTAQKSDIPCILKLKKCAE